MLIYLLSQTAICNHYQYEIKKRITVAELTYSLFSMWCISGFICLLILRVKIVGQSNEGLIILINYNIFKPVL